MKLKNEIEYFLTILTPTYNRAEYLNNVYNSLKMQECKNFCWLIIDDGSTDNTYECVQNFEYEGFDITYKKKSNGGKHSAINYALQHINSELVMILDSDDTLTCNATQTIENIYRSIDNDILYGGFVFLMKRPDGKLFGESFDEDIHTLELTSFYAIPEKKIGEKFWVYKSNVLKKFRFPEYSNEKYVPEGYLYASILNEYIFIPVNECLCIAEYQEGGLTDRGRIMRIESACGMCDTHGHISTLLKGKNIKVNIGFYAYYFFLDSKKKQMMHEKYKGKINVIWIPFGILVYLFWNFKYLKKNKKRF